jgi:DNA invertase Pin-like site-specific DNA recombinase
MNEGQRKVTPRHLMRKAFLYVRQSTMRQVMENTESTERQYALRQRAVALGWPLEQVEVIDRDLGHSAAAAADREGFKTLVSEVGLGHAGIVMGLEVSRLARNSTDWHRLLEICALSDTLILDEDGVYDPAQFNDRLLLGLKGTMSEAELHVLKARLRGGLLNKARRGELKTALPVGFVHDAQDRVRLDPDTQVQQAIRFFFDTFQRTGTSTATVRSFGKEKIAFPRRLRAGPRKGELVWGGLTEGRALSLLRNPRYAGAFVFGRTRQRFHGDGKRVTTRKPREEWVTLQREAHEGYVTWAQYEENQRRLSENAQAHGLDHRRCPPREGPALLQGLLLCGVCGTGMSVRYYSRGDDLTPHYSCRGRANKQGEPGCQSSSGAGIDAAIGPLVLEALSPLSLEVSLAVQQEIEGRLEEADGLRRKQVERARYEADLARHRYMQVDPANRLVADELEGDWNKKLTALTQAQQEYERRRQQDRLQLDEAARARILSLATDVPRLWADPKTPQRERKQVVRFLLEDVTLLKNDAGLTLHVRFKGGATRTLNLAAPKTAWEERQTTAEVIAEIDRRLDEHTFDEIAALLNERKFVSGTGLPFHGDRVEYLCRFYKLKPRLDRLREAGLLTLDELAARLGRSKHTIKAWRRQGRLPVAARKLDDNGRHMYEAPGAAGVPGELPNAAGSYEVQCE